jgi:alkylhydroperoxidase/carboxymuconolactone decarboxylase family protein YurZ
LKLQIPQRRGSNNKTVRLIKLAIAIGAMREGAVHSGVRKALAAGIAVDEIEQVVASAAEHARNAFHGRRIYLGARRNRRALKTANR